MRFDNSGSYVFIHVQQQGPEGILHSKEQISNILDKWNIKICNLNLTFKHTEDQVLRSSSPPNRRIGPLKFNDFYTPKRQMISCINRKRSPFKIKPFSDIYVKFQGNWRELKFSKCHGHFQTRIPSPNVGREIGHQNRRHNLGGSSKIWLNFSPKVKVSKLLGNFTLLKGWRHVGSIGGVISKWCKCHGNGMIL